MNGLSGSSFWRPYSLHVDLPKLSESFSLLSFSATPCAFTVSLCLQTCAPRTPVIKARVSVWQQDPDAATVLRASAETRV